MQIGKDANGKNSEILVLVSTCFRVKIKNVTSYAYLPLRYQRYGHGPNVVIESFQLIFLLTHFIHFHIIFSLH